MSDIQKKLEDYINDKESNEDFFPDEDVALMEKMLDFILNLDSESLNDDQSEEIADIIDEIADSPIDLDLVTDGFSARKVKIKPSDKRQRRMEYRRNRAAIKLRAKKFRKTTKYKQYKRKRDRKVRQGKTSTGKRIRKFL
jgi:hypothetical protein